LATRPTIALVVLVGALTSGGAVAEPKLNLHKPDQPARVGQSFPVVCEVTWTGDAEDYTILPAEINPIDWGDIKPGPMVGSVRDGENVVAQTVEFIPEQSGEYATPEIRFSWLIPEESQAPESGSPTTYPNARSVPPSLRVSSFTLPVKPKMTHTWLSGALGVFLLCSLVGWWLARRARQPQPQLVSSKGLPDFHAVESALRTAKQRRLDDNYYEYYRELSRAAKLLGGDDGIAEELDRRSKEIGFGGVRSLDDEMDSDLRSVERAINEARKE